MDRILNIIKKAGSGAVEAGNPTAILFGSVTATDPLEVNVDQRFSLEEDFLIVPESLTHFEIDLKHLHGYQDTSDSGDTPRDTKESLLAPIVIRRGLEVNDVVLLLRVQGGQQYVILDRLVLS
jgi:hypothetical protein